MSDVTKYNESVAAITISMYCYVIALYDMTVVSNCQRITPQSSSPGL